MRPTAVVFDIGNVLLEWDPRHLYRKLLPDDDAVEHFLATVCTPEWNREQDAGRPWAEAVAELSARFPDQRALIEAYDARWEEMIPGEVEGTVGVLGELHAADVPLFAITNFSDDKFRLAWARFGFLGWFRDIVVSGQEGVLKPGEDIFRLALRRFGLAPGDAVFVDDLAANVEGAAAAGMHGLLFTDARTLRADLVALGLLGEAGTNGRAGSACSGAGAHAAPRATSPRAPGQSP